MKEELQLDHTYLIRYGSNTDMLNSVTVLLITAKAYHFRHNTGLNTSTSWMQKDYFERSYTIIEDISDFVAGKLQDEYKFTYTYGAQPYTLTYDGQPVQYYYTITEDCSFCHGTGQISDFTSTGGKMTCTLCNGSGKVMKTIDVLSK